MFNSDKVKIVGLTRKMDKLAKRFYMLADPKADTSAGLMHDHIVLWKTQYSCTYTLEIWIL